MRVIFIKQRTVQVDQFVHDYENPGVFYILKSSGDFCNLSN